MTHSDGRTVLYRNGRIHSRVAGATALLTEGDRIAWVGAEDGASLLSADVEVDLDGAFVTPSFVDSHVHATSTGLALTGLDLSGATSLAAALDLIAAHAGERPGGVLIGTGWDDTAWPERRPPSLTELDRAARGAAAYLSRVDVHSALVSSALLDRAPEARGLPGAPAGADDAVVRLDAHHALRRVAQDQVTTPQRRAAQQATLRRAAELGIGCVQEMAGPEVSSETDLVELIALADAEPGPVVLGYWGELGRLDLVEELGLAGAGGDLFCDGALGSHTAALHLPYRDRETSGSLRYDVDAIADHVRLCTAAGIQAGFHAIGDLAVDSVVAAIGRVADELGVPAVAALGHRIEHCEFASLSTIREMARLGVVASVQPAFDAAWGGPDGMYADRLGADRAGQLNPFAAFASAGVRLAFGSDAPVTPLDPWAGVRAAVRHRTAGFGLSPRAAFVAASRGGWRAAGHPDQSAGEIVSGAPAMLAFWETGELVVRTPDTRVQAWSTDPRAGTPGLPDLDEGAPAPRCLRTVVVGEAIYDSGELGKR